MRIRAPHLRDLQGPAGRPGARPDLRLHASAARFRARRRRGRGAAPSRRRQRRGAGMPRVTDLLGGEGLIEPLRRGRRRRAGRRPHARAARRFRPTATCGCRAWRAATKASCWRSAIRRSAATAAPIRSPARSGSARSRSSSSPEELGFAVPLGRIDLTECQMVNQFKGSAERAAAVHARLRPRASATASARPWRWRWSTARCARANWARRCTAPAQDEEFVLVALPTMCRRPASSSI